jgi:hypothetical protein
MEGEVERDEVGEAAYAARHLAGEVGGGEVEVGEACEPLEAGGWYLRHAEIVSGEVETSQRGQILE